MRPLVSVGTGGCIQFINSPMGPRVVSQDLCNAPVTTAAVLNEYSATLVAGASNDYWASLWGGPLSMLPGNHPHRPGAFYFGNFYFYKHKVAVTSSAQFLLRFDGSGIYFNKGGTQFDNKSLSGRGVQFISPSGIPEIDGGPMCVIPHNGLLFYVGSTRTRNWNTSTSNYITKLGWHTGPNDNFQSTGSDGTTGLPRRRAYCSYAIVKTSRNGPEKKIFGKLAIKHNRTLPSGLTTSYEDLNACDAISWGDDIIYANNVDLVQFPGGSGVPRIIEITNSPTSKCFEPYPSGGFDQNNGNSIGNTELLFLTGSGVLKKIKFPGDPGYDSNGVPFGNSLFETPQSIASGNPFGTTSLVNLGSLVSDFFGPKVRVNGQRGRVGSLTAEPDRTCFLKTHNNRLHAFFISASSGYYHFTCEGDPRNIDNWTDRTPSLPINLKIRDGNLYGYRDDYFGTLNLLHVAYSNVGLLGTQGANKGAGGWTLYQINDNLQWQTLYTGASNGPPVGLIPYNPEGIFVQIPSGIKTGVAPGNPVAIPSTDYVEIEYLLHTPRRPNRFADVVIEYSIDDGSTWLPARRFKDYVTGLPLGEGTTNLEASPEGTVHTFLWAHVSDLGFNFNRGAKLRVTPTFVR